MITTPAMAMAKYTHCIFLTFSLSKKMAIMAVNKGLKYCMDTALAMEMFCRVIKKRVKAVTPAKPLISSHALLLPKTASFCLFRATKQRLREIIDLKNISSWAGMFSRNFTKVFTKANMLVDSNINSGPFALGEICIDQR